MRVKLEEVCERGSSNLKQSDVVKMSGKYPIYGASGHIGNADFYHQDKPYVSVIKDGAGIGRAYLNPAKSSVIGTMQYLLPKNNVIPKYLYYVIRYMHLEKYYTGATIPHIYYKDYKNEQFNLASLEKQERVVEVLEKCEKIINNRRSEIGKLDELIKARFVEMFGDPIRNTQNRKTTEFISVVKMQRGFDLAVQKRKQDGNIPVYGSNGVLDYHNEAKVKNGGIITGRSGTIGKVFFTEGDYWPLNTTLFSVDKHANNVVYLAYLLELFDLTRFAEGTGVPTLNRNMFHKKQIIDVPIEEQNQFADFVHQVNKSKVVFDIQLKNITILLEICSIINENTNGKMGRRLYDN